MENIKWIKIWILIASMLILMVGVFNYLIDPLGFNNKVVLENINNIKESNTHFAIKYKMPLLENGGWDNLMLGTSRIGVFDTDIVNKYLGGETFTMSLPASVTPMHYDSFLYALKFNKIKNLIYGIDFMSFNKNAKLNDDYVQYKEKIQSFSSLYTYDIYFNLDTLKKSFVCIWNNRSDKPKRYEYYSENGMRHYPDLKLQFDSGKLNIDTNIKKHMKAYFEKTGIYIDYEYSGAYMEEFAKIVKYCKKNGINIYVFIPPIYIDHFYALKEAGLRDEFELFKRELVKIVEYIDFTGENSLTMNKCNFWDSSHLRKEKSHKVLYEIFNIKNRDKKLTLGTWVTKTNIEKHLEEQRDQYRSVGLAKVLKTIYKD